MKIPEFKLPKFDLFKAMPWIIGALVLILLLVSIGSYQHKQDFMRECMADGNKWYQCESMYRTANPAPQTHIVIAP